MGSLKDMLAEKEASERRELEVSSNLENLNEKLKGIEKRSQFSFDEVHKKLIEHDLRFTAQQQEMDLVKISKEKLFEEVCSNLDDLIGSKFSLSAKLQSSDQKISNMLKELVEKQEVLEEDLQRVKLDYEINLGNMQKENEAYSQELKRMQIFNREMVEKFNLIGKKSSKF